MSLDQLRQVRTEQRLCYLSMSLLVLVVLLNPFNPASRLLQCEIDLVSSQADSNPCWRKSLYITWPNLPSLDSSKTCHLVNIPTQTKWSIKALASLSTHFSPASSQYVIKYCVVATIRRSETRVFVYKYKWRDLILIGSPLFASPNITLDSPTAGCHLFLRYSNYEQVVKQKSRSTLLSLNHPQQRCKSGTSSSLGYNWVCLCKSPYRTVADKNVFVFYRVESVCVSEYVRSASSTHAKSIYPTDLLQSIKQITVYSMGLSGNSLPLNPWINYDNIT